MRQLLLKTNLADARAIPRLHACLRRLGIRSWSLDLADSRHLLRVTLRSITPARLLAALRQDGIDCELVF
jgi:ATP phosphoribosyltransferase regulatory subunit HisZ